MRNILLLLIMLITSAGNAQTALPDDTLRTVEGKVVNENGEAVEYATVALLTVTDSSVVSGALTDSVGRFSLTTSHADSRLMVRVTMVGYAAIYSRLPLRAPLRLIHKANELKEVTVTAARNFVKTNALGLTVEMEGNPLANLGSAEDAIRMMPMMDASSQGISVLGKGAPLIYINNRKLRDSGELKRLLPENIKSVEIITTPTAKYGSGVNAVLIIHTKKRDEGLAGTLWGSGTLAEVALGSAYSNFSYMTAKGLGFYAGGSVSHSGYMQDRTYDESFNNGLSGTSTAGKYKGSSDYVSGTAGASYDFGKANSIGARYEFSRTPRSKYNADSDILTTMDGTENKLASTNNDFSQSMRHYVNAYAVVKFGKKQNFEFTADADYLYGRGERDQHTEEKDAAGTVETVNTVNRNSYNLFATKANLNMVFGKVSIDVGGEYSHTKNRVNYNGVTVGITKAEDYIRQNLASGYFNLVYSPTKYLTFVGGLRLEHTAFDYYQNGTHVDGQSKSYTDWLPKLTASYGKGDWRAGLSYIPAVYRPNYSMLNNNYYYISHTAWSTGNPDLRTSTPHSIELNLSWKKTYFYATYSMRRHSIDYVYEYIPESNINLQRPINLPNSEDLQLVLSHSMDIGLWHPTIQGAICFTNFEYNGQKYDKPLGLVSMNNRFDLPLGIYAYLTAYWKSCGNNNTYYMYDVSSVSLTLSKRLGNWRFNLYANDILGTFRQKHSLSTNGVTIKEYRKGASQLVQLSVTYTFRQKQKKSYKGKGTGTSELNRL